ncbi:MAG: hypothetical protein KKA60_10185 [Proteobacteria bacterium]|nr:hypothetical protein [Pseudomonadota bacterium]
MPHKVRILDSGSWKFILEMHDGRVTIWPYHQRKAVEVEAREGCKHRRLAFRKLLDGQAAWRGDKGMAASWCRRFASDPEFREVEIGRFKSSLEGAEAGEGDQ